ncbi:YfaP family protein [Fibrella aquatica]|uniref:YfaP family protein n=1 Tax=Fibrella aquatica TaxID=3242487 RepID=UPI003521F603
MFTHYTSVRSLVASLLLIVCLFACKKADVDPQETLIDPSDANSLSPVLLLPAGATRVQGDAPAPTGGSAAPQAANPVQSVISSNGSTVLIPFNYANVSGNLAGCYAQVVGASQYINIPYNSTSGAAGSLQLSLGIPTRVDQGSFRVAFCVYDRNGRVSQVVYVTVNVLRLGTGALQISLSWSTPTDQDLHVVDPSGDEIYYGNPSSSTGGELDRDDLDGYGPENIFWLDAAPDGSYKVTVEDYDYTSTPNPFVVTVSSPGKSKSFSGQTLRGNTVNVVTIQKSGTTYTY